MGVTGAITAAAAVIGTGAGIHSSEVARKASKKQRKNQSAAQSKQAMAAAEQNRRAADEASKLRTPDASTLLGDERKAGSAGPASTLLSGSRGVRRGSMLLGQQSVLGG